MIAVISQARESWNICQAGPATSGRLNRDIIDAVWSLDLSPIRWFTASLDFLDDRSKRQFV
jgi:hypothetical protein